MISSVNIAVAITEVEKMTLGKVFSHIQSLYQQALIDPTIRKPMAWTLYQTWKWVDKQEAERGDEDDR